MNASASMKNRGGSRPATRGWKTSRLLAAALPACLGLISLQAEALPDEVGGNATNADQMLPGGWTNLRSVPVVNGNQPRWCIATCSADIRNTGAPGQTTLFTITLNAPPALDGGCERTVQFDNVPDGDVAIKEVTTTCGPFLTPAALFPIPAITSFMRCWANPVSPVPQTVLDSSMTVTCTDTRTETVP